MLNIQKKLVMLMALIAVPFMACDDSTSAIVEEAISSVQVVDQSTKDGNTVTINNLVSSVDGWVVIHRSNSTNNGPQVPDIIGKAQVNAGANSNVVIQLEEGVANDETLWAMLHEDTGDIGTYEFDGQNGLDNPLFYMEELVMVDFQIMQTNPKITVADQVNQGNIFTLDVDAAEDGWIVIHASNSTNDGPQIPEIIARAQVNAGMNLGVEIPLDAGVTVAAGDMLYPMLHFDTGTIGAYEFDGQNGFDGPVFFDGGIVLSSFTVLENQSTMTALDQMIIDNSITVDVTSDTDGWVVVHASNATNNGPQVPGIIGKAQITAGVNADVKITFDAGVVVEDGDVLYPMVHFDTGAKGVYEFDGVGINDQPVVTADGVLVTAITGSGATAPKVSVSDQAVSEGTLTIAETMAEQIGFVVLHLDNGSDAPLVPASIGNGQVYTGNNNNLVITLDEGVSLEAGTKVWAMLHIDNGTIGSYDFNGMEGSDDPPYLTVKVML